MEALPPQAEAQGGLGNERTGACSSATHSTHTQQAQHTTHNTHTRNKKCTHVKQRSGAQKEKANSTIDLTKHTTETVNEGLKFKSGLEGGWMGHGPSRTDGCLSV